MAAFSKGHRADIRRAERDGVVIRVGAPEPDADVLHQMLVATNSARASASTARPTTGGCCTTSATRRAPDRGARRRADRRIADPGLRPHGTYLAAGSNAAGLEHRAAHLLQWHAIRWAKERGALTWDLWGIADARGRYELAAAAGSMSAA